MISNPFFLLSILISSFLAFFTVAFAVEISMMIFRIKQHRIRSLLRLLPFISLIIDLLFNQYSLVSWLNPLNCSSCMQKLFLEVFVPHLKSYLAENQLSLLCHLGCVYHSSVFSAIFISLGALCLIFVLSKFIQAFFLTYPLHSIAKRAMIHKPLINSMQLNLMLQKNKVNIYVSHETLIPLTIYPNIIIIPQKTIEILSQDEFEAVIAHEWEHIKYKDPLTRLVYHLVAAFFWWIPTRAWIKKIEEEQELACDQNVAKYGISVDSIASALCKVAKQVKGHQTICYFANPENSTLRRIQALLGLNKKNQNPMLELKFFGMLLGAILLLICSISL